MKLPDKFKPVLAFLWVYVVFEFIALTGMVVGSYGWTVVSLIMWAFMWPVFIFAAIYYLYCYDD